MNIKKLAVLLAIVALVAAFFVFDLNQYFSLDAIKAQQQALNTQVIENPLIAGGIFFVVYVLVTALSLPGAALMTLAGGAIWPWLGPGYRVFRLQPWRYSGHADQPISVAGLGAAALWPTPETAERRHRT